MKNFLYKFGHHLEKIKTETAKKRSEKLDKLEALQQSIIKDFDTKIQKLNEKRQEIHASIIEKISSSKEKQIERLNNLRKLRKSVVEEFDKQIENLTEKRDLIGEALRKKIELKKFKISALKTIFPLQLRYLISVPFIYGMIIPAVILHIFVEVFHQVCFSLYKIPKVKAKDYFIFDRKHLPYLNWIEKINCAYCSYFNCLIAYTREIGARTERYWCPIKHANKLKAEHSHYDLFFDFLEAEDYRKQLKKLREFKEK